ncbi:ECF RNA polymerase sigma factor SigL [Frankia sp. AiPs1]|uniref:sigma-70 family RNA polymerase sigma factor n=1 Tax=Frankia sp. AiPa1 TaxID=573492 RepID=UPI00202AE9D9|nr:sigma-70 family RNA polymerase sigma factor [Frankia sp. AiPa1]MCL9762192.1 sigma-70 family RNA polymerase sigma factor [Frankia sp. AiPa1]
MHARWRGRGGQGVDDPAAEFVRAVYAEHGPAVLAFVTRMTGDRARAEDVLQETVLRAWRHAGRLGTDERPLRPWLFTVANRIVVDEHRARRVRPAEVGSENLESLPAGNELDRAMESWQVAEAFRALSPEHRAALVETYYLGRSVAEAAANLGIPPGTVKSRVFYGLRALRLALEERGWAT